MNATCILLEPMQKPSKGAAPLEPSGAFEGLTVLSATDGNAGGLDRVLGMQRVTPSAFRQEFAGTGTRA